MIPSDSFALMLILSIAFVINSQTNFLEKLDDIYSADRAGNESSQPEFV